MRSRMQRARAGGVVCVEKNQQVCVCVCVCVCVVSEVTMSECGMRVVGTE